MKLYRVRIDIDVYMTTVGEPPTPEAIREATATCVEEGFGVYPPTIEDMAGELAFNSLRYDEDATVQCHNGWTLPLYQVRDTMLNQPEPTND
jgi:hypothetical protein